jgi:hypothetical protein
MSLILDGSNGLSDVDGTAATPAIRGTDTNTGIFFPATDTIAFSEGGTESMRINGSGNVGIGTTSGTERLSVASGDTYQISFKNTGASSIGALGYDATNNMRINVNGAERMRIDSSGNLLVGTTSNTNSAKFVVNGRVGFFDASGQQNSVQFIPNKGLGTTNSAGFGLSFTTVNYTPASASSNIYWDGNTGYFTLSTSSKKYKRNITSVTNEQLDKALLLQPSYYQRLEYDYWEYGFIAEQVQEIGLDEFVTKTEGEVSGLNYEKMVTLAFGLIQRQEKQINDLTARIAALESAGA